MATVAISGTQTISAPILLSTSASFTPDDSGLLSLSGSVGDNGAGMALVLAATGTNGTGQLVLSGSNNYTGGTYVNSGTLIATVVGAIPDGTALYVGTGASGLFASSVVPAYAPIVASSHDVVAVPEPGTIVLLLAGLGSAAIYCRFRRPKDAGFRHTQQI
jgi:autotransporter-associated beta strand protein